MEWPEAEGGLRKNWPALSQLSLPGPTEELTLNDVFMAVQNCNHTLVSLSTQFHHLENDVTIMQHDMQKVQERTSALEGQVSNVEDKRGPIQRDLKVVGLQTNHHANRIDDL